MKFCLNLLTCSFSLACLWLLSSVQRVSGHGVLTSPRSRNWYAHMEGTDAAKAGVPLAEYCQHCLNLNSGICGNSSTTNYDDWPDSLGKKMPWKSQAKYSRGDTIRTTFKITANHRGYITLRACPLGRQSTYECLDDYPLVFVKDLTYGMPADPDYPERGYLTTNTGDVVMDFKLPDDLVGNKTILQVRSKHR